MTDTTPQHVKNTCKIGQGEECCRYVMFGADGFECAKLTSMRAAIDDRSHQMGANGDNCPGREGVLR